MMNRELKFRAWNKSEEIMSFSQSKIHRLGLWFNSILVTEKVIVIMQFTDLKDKPGRDIYESDKLYSNNEYVGYVSMSNGSYRLIDNDECCKYGRILNQEICNRLEIIGNIHENLEFISGE